MATMRSPQWTTDGSFTGAKELAQSVIQNYSHWERQPDPQPMPPPGL